MNTTLKGSDENPVVTLNICAKEIAVFREITVVYATGVHVWKQGRKKFNLNDGAVYKMGAVGKEN